MVPLTDPSFGARGGSGLGSRRERGPGSAGHSQFTQSDLGAVPSPRGAWWPSAIPLRWFASV